MADAAYQRERMDQCRGLIWVGLTDIMTIMEMRLSTVKRMKSCMMLTGQVFAVMSKTAGGGTGKRNLQECRPNFCLIRKPVDIV